jgi:hypothetical protein
LNIRLCEVKIIIIILKPVNLEFNKLVRWADGTNEPLTKRLTFQVFFFS